MNGRPFDSTVSFLREGYAFVSSRCDAWDTDLFSTRMFLQPTTFIRGEEAAGIFYAGSRFTREAAMPPSVQHLLQDKGSSNGQSEDWWTLGRRCPRRTCRSVSTGSRLCPAAVSSSTTPAPAPDS